MADSRSTVAWPRCLRCSIVPLRDTQLEIVWNAFLEGTVPADECCVCEALWRMELAAIPVGELLPDIAEWVEAHADCEKHRQHDRRRYALCIVTF